MEVPKDLYKRITEKHGAVIDLKQNPEVLSDIVKELRSLEQADFSDHQKATESPFKVSWLDSWAAQWILHQNKSALTPEKETSSLMRQLVDLKFRERLTEIKKFINEYDLIFREAPDGGPPEPGTPPVGPASFVDEPPDGGTPEPGVPPDPPGPGPEGEILRDNPWVLYWFVSINAPLILDMIDAHFTRRMNDLKLQNFK